MQSIATSEDAEVGQRSSRGRTVKSMCEFRITMDFGAAGSLSWFWCSCTSRQTIMFSSPRHVASNQQQLRFYHRFPQFSRFH